MASRGQANVSARRRKPAMRHYLRYAATDALREDKRQGSLLEWPRLASLVAERLAARRNARTTWAITPTRCRRAGPSRSGPASNQLERLLGYPWPYAGRPQKDDLSSWTVTDDWPARVPVTSVEVDVFEAWLRVPAAA